MVINKGETKALWEVTLAVEGTPTDVWNAETGTVNAGGKFSGVHDNAELNPGATASFGFCWRGVSRRGVPPPRGGAGARPCQSGRAGASRVIRRAPICLEFCYPARPSPASRAGRKPRTPQ